MRVHVELYAQLRELAGLSTMQVDLPDRATVAELIEQICQLKPALGAHDKNILVGVGVDFVQRDHVLSEDEEIAIMPPVQGG